MRRTYFFILIVLLSSAYPSRAASPRETDIQTLVQRIETEAGFKVFYKGLAEQVKDRIVYSGAASSEYEDLYAFLKIFEAEIQKYPAKIFRDSKIKAVLLVKRNFYDGKPIEGLYDRVNNTMMLDFLRFRKNSLLQKHSIHHEIYHMLETSRDLDPVFIKEWEGLNPPDFQYSRKELKTSRINPFNAFAPAWPGFATDYAMTSGPEDRAELFACLMLPQDSKLINKWIQKDRYLGKKVVRLISLVTYFSPELGGVLARAVHFDMPRPKAGE